MFIVIVHFPGTTSCSVMTAQNETEAMFMVMKMEKAGFEAVWYSILELFEKNE